MPPRRRARFFDAAFFRVAAFAAVFRAILRPLGAPRRLRAVLRADARVAEPARFFDGARFRLWLERFREELPAFRRAVFFAMCLTLSDCRVHDSDRPSHAIDCRPLSDVSSIAYRN